MEPKKYFEEPNIKWKYITNRSVISTAAIKNDIAFFGTDDGVLHAVDINDGKKKWTYKTSGRRLTKPTIADGYVFFGSSDHHLYAISLKTGEEVWKFKTGADINSEPTFINGKVVIGSHDKHLYFINSINGDEHWKFKVEKGIFTKPVYESNSIYFADSDYVYALDVEKKKLKWKKNSSIILPKNLAISKRLILFGSVEGFMGDQYICALEKKTGKLQWKFKGDFSIYGEPEVYKNKIFKNGAWSGGFAHFYAINISSGELEWEFVLEDKLVFISNFDVNNGSIIFGISNVYGKSNSTDLYALEANTGQVKWKLPLDVGISLRPQPTIQGQIVLVGTNDGLYAIEFF